MERCPKCNAVLAVKQAAEVSDNGTDAADRTWCMLLYCPNRACEKGRSGELLLREIVTALQPGTETQET